jgi:TetR/AcrR family transcriptional regulator, cholesterol catabolism regulator|tara:strand:- start:35 stop:676 length:642 start_codon:yes stop_codon:yes gene_type:complete
MKTLVSCEAESKIIEDTHSLINKHGVKVLSMDEIARLLSISKKTLYKYFQNKKELVLKCFKHRHNQMLKDISILENKHENIIDLFFAMDDHIINTSKSIRKNPQMIENLKKYHPESFKFMNNLRKLAIVSAVSRIVLKGIEQGLLRKEINVEIVTELIVSNIYTITDTKIFPRNQYKFEHLVKEKRELHLRGLATKRGVNYFEKNQKIENDRK